MVMAYIKGHDRNQIILFPDVMDDYISENSTVRIIDEYVDQLDVEILGFKNAICAATGRPPFNPKDQLKLYIYGYLNRIRSSRRLEDQCKINIELIWLLKRLSPDFKTICDFRKNNKKALKMVFRDFNKLCDEWNLFGKELVAVDGSKFRACNSKKNNFSLKKLDRHIKYIDERIDKYLDDLDEGDVLEENHKNHTSEEIKNRIEELRNRKKKYSGYKDKLVERGENEISTTDPDARLMCNNNNNVDVSYNIQTTVDSKHKLIADFKVTNKPNDLGELDNMVLRAKKLFGEKDFEVLADKGYYKAEDLKKCVDNGITPYVTKQVYSNGTGDRDFYGDKFTYEKDRNLYICPANQELRYFRDKKKDGKVKSYEYKNFKACSVCEFKGRCTKSKMGRIISRHVDQDFLDTIDLETELNMDKYRLRQTIVEHPFGTLKRNWGAYYFLTKTKLSVTAEMSILILAYNMKRAINILGNEEILRKLRERRKIALV